MNSKRQRIIRTITNNKGRGWGQTNDVKDRTVVKRVVLVGVVAVGFVAFVAMETGRVRYLGAWDFCDVG